MSQTLLSWTPLTEFNLIHMLGAVWLKDLNGHFTLLLLNNIIQFAIKYRVLFFIF